MHHRVHWRMNSAEMNLEHLCDALPVILDHLALLCSPPLYHLASLFVSLVDDFDVLFAFDHT